MIIRPENLIYVNETVEFNFQSFSVLEIDLEHINKNSRSSLEVKDVVEIFKCLIDGKFLESSGESEFEEHFCSYFSFKGDYKAKNYKVVFCICSDRPSSLGLITLFRVR